MSGNLPVSPALLTTAIVAMIFVIVLPFVLGSIAHKRLAVGWKYFWYGTLVFLVSQLLTRLPLITLLQNTVLARLLTNSPVFVWTWLIVLAITAAIFEEGGRFIGYQLLMRKEAKSWSKAVMYGLGHEGLESVVLVGGEILLILVQIAIFSIINIHQLPAAQRQNIIQQLNMLRALPAWFPLLSSWQRLWSFPLQVALSVLVLQVFRRQQGYWLVLAMLLHALVDFLTLALPYTFGQGLAVQLAVNGIICIFGLLCLWIIWRLREPERKENV